NENPYPPSPKVLAAIRDAATGDLRLYPDPNADQLKQAIADHHHVSAKQVFVGNSSDEVLALTFLALLKHEKPILFPDITYSFYPVYCALYEIASRQIPLREDYSLHVDDYLVPNGGIIFPNPNAPTGRLLAIDEVERLLIATPDSVVVVDEAYVDFGGVSAIALVNQYANLLVIQTLSKSRSLAGLRVGLAIGHPDLITALERVKNSFNSYPLDRLAIAGATAAFVDAEYFKQTCAAVISTREKLVASLEHLGFEVVPSSANFVLIKHPQHDALQLQAYLRSKAIIVRHFKQARIAQHLRVTIGTDDQCRALVHALSNFPNPKN
ncbi:MAG: histidinol-phosphate transaminase, partial [Pseudomonadota bacterium]